MILAFDYYESLYLLSQQVEDQEWIEYGWTCLNRGSKKFDGQFFTKSGRTPSNSYVTTVSNPIHIANVLSCISWPTTTLLNSIISRVHEMPGFTLGQRSLISLMSIVSNFNSLTYILNWTAGDSYKGSCLEYINQEILGLSQKVYRDFDPERNIVPRGLEMLNDEVKIYKNLVVFWTSSFCPFAKH